MGVMAVFIVVQVTILQLPDICNETTDNGNVSKLVIDF